MGHGKINRRRLDGLREGDKIQVFSGGDKIDGVGVFIRIEDGFLIWVDNHANINITSLDVISVRRVVGSSSSDCCIDKGK
ncbi:hypothetical protein QUF99_00080 [Bacillus sp. DX4.1]|uniref:hypothetical protein n=1 Tax=Bacillus sp. DX4.1 TaxID=3055867 RepID=UPI0025A11542|nr:hypothetical protein [Bacillus sp. DX4.1]MDM5185906.1 hypothetical protein [Bacillus sp. DX4.1]